MYPYQPGLCATALIRIKSDASITAKRLKKGVIKSDRCLLRLAFVRFRQCQPDYTVMLKRDDIAKKPDQYHNRILKSRHLCRIRFLICCCLPVPLCVRRFSGQVAGRENSAALTGNTPACEAYPEKYHVCRYR